MTVDVKQPECGPKRGSPSLPRNACHRKFYNETCLQLHVTQGVCQTLKRCPECCKQFDPRDESLTDAITTSAVSPRKLSIF